MISYADSSSASRLLAIEIGGTKLQLVVGTREGVILERRRFTVESFRGAGGIRECIAAALPELVKQWTPLAIGVGYGGPVNWRTGRIVKSYHLSGWNDFPLAEWLRDLSGLPVFVENDGNVAALGEALHGAGRGCDPVFYVTTGSGVGGGLACEGRIFHGFTPGEAEIGHLLLERVARRRRTAVRAGASIAASVRRLSQCRKVRWRSSWPPRRGMKRDIWERH